MDGGYDFDRHSRLDDWSFMLSDAGIDLREIAVVESAAAVIVTDRRTGGAWTYGPDMARRWAVRSVNDIVKSRANALSVEPVAHPTPFNVASTFDQGGRYAVARQRLVERGPIGGGHDVEVISARDDDAADEHDAAW